jgi:hypothetical protein
LIRWLPFVDSLKLPPAWSFWLWHVICMTINLLPPWFSYEHHPQCPHQWCPRIFSCVILSPSFSFGSCDTMRWVTRYVRVHDKLDNHMWVCARVFHVWVETDENWLFL